MNTQEQSGFTHAEKRQIGTVIGALALSGCGVVLVSRAARRVPMLRKRLQSPNWRMRLACAGFMLSYRLLSRFQAGDDSQEATETPDSSPQPAA
jgi:hypothetical protein